MAKDEGWGRRLRTARRAYEERHDAGLTYEEIGERLGRLLKRAAFKHSTVRAWFTEGQEPDSFEVARALATVLEADAGHLITGGPMAATPIDVPAPAPAALPPMDMGEDGRVWAAAERKRKATREGGHRKKRGA